MNDKIYIGNGKEKTFDNGGSVINCMITMDGLAQIFKDHGFTTQNGVKKLKLIIGKRREIDQYGNSHYVQIDTWKPDQQATAPAQTEDDIPF